MYQIAERRDDGEPIEKEAAMAKLFATEMAERVTGEAIDIDGGQRLHDGAGGGAVLARRPPHDDSGHVRDPASYYLRPPPREVAMIEREH